MSNKSEKVTCIFMSGLSPRVDSDGISKAIQKYGTIKRCSVFKSLSPGYSCAVIVTESWKHNPMKNLEEIKT
jgi:hypothetical protein